MKLLCYISVILLFGCSPENSKKEIKNATEIQIESWFEQGLDETQKDIDKLKQLADSIQSKKNNVSNEHRAMGELLRAFYFTKTSNDSKNFESLTKANQLLSNSKADSLKIKTFNSLGQNFKSNGDFSTAMDYFLRALRLAEKTHSEKEQGNIHSAIGDIYFQKGELPRAKKHLDKAIALLQSNKKRTNYLVASHNLANYMGMTGNLEKALELDAEGLAICDEINSNRLKVTFLDNKANCFFYSGRIDSAEVYFKECLRLDKLNKNIEQESDSYLNLAHVATAKNDSKNVLAYIDSSLTLAKKTNYKMGILKAYEILVGFHKKNGNSQALIENQELYFSSYKDLVNTKKESAIARYSTIYETEKKEIKLLKAKVDLAEREKQIQSKNSLLQMIGLLAIALIGLAYLVYRQLKLRNAQQKQEFELKTALKEIESQNLLQNQRLRISRDLHDNIGAQLTFIISSVENLSYSFEIKDPAVSGQLNKINDFAQSTIIELRDTIWAMNSKTITFENLQDRIHNFLEKAKGVKDSISFNFTLDDKLKQHSFSSLIGINVYRVLQEAVNNAIKYSEANEINVKIGQENDKIFISITDDGIGFDTNTVEYGNGIHNMKKRMAEINAVIKIESTKNQGTKIYLTCPKT